MKQLLKFTICALVLISAYNSAYSQNPDKRLVGYFTSRSVYVRDYHVPDIPADKITHINYAFVNISPSQGTIILGDPYADIEKFYPGDSWDTDSLRGSFQQPQILKGNHPNVKTLISVGGWTWSVYFSNIALAAESRDVFAVSCADCISPYF